jgi:hypothetical protein
MMQIQQIQEKKQLDKFIENGFHTILYYQMLGEMEQSNNHFG